jgi:endonuclease/exonuclease/phosphatase family metal-dependent hydrolase
VRILNTGLFEYKITGSRVIACCTHLDNEGSESREKSVIVILEKIKQLRKQWAVKNEILPVFLSGDFNSFPDQEAYRAMEASDLMCDLRNYVESKNQYGDTITFTGFQPEKDKEEQGRIDFIWLGPKDKVEANIAPKTQLSTHNVSKDQGLGWKVDGYAVLPNVYEDGVYSSDHRCVVGT